MDKRRAHRLKIEIPATLKRTRDQAHISIATTLDISAMGLCLRVKERLQMGDQVIIQLQLSDRQTATLNAKVVWVKDDEFLMGPDFIVGIKITQSLKTEEIKFIQFYVKKLFEYFKYE